jgi:hypothetical protein
MDWKTVKARLPKFTTEVGTVVRHTAEAVHITLDNGVTLRLRREGRLGRRVEVLLRDCVPNAARTSALKR